MCCHIKWRKFNVQGPKYSGHLKQSHLPTLIAGFMGPTWGPSGADRTQVGPMLATWILLSGKVTLDFIYRVTWQLYTAILWLSISAWLLNAINKNNDGNIQCIQSNMSGSCSGARWYVWAQQIYLAIPFKITPLPLGQSGFSVPGPMEK